MIPVGLAAIAAESCDPKQALAAELHYLSG
jgi:hypothetical protein